VNEQLPTRARLNAIFDAYDTGNLPVLTYLTVLVTATSGALFADVRLGLSLKFLIPLTLLFTGFLLVAVPYVFHRIKHTKSVNGVDQPSETGSPAADQLYVDRRDEARLMIKQLQHSDISPQAKVILLKVLYALVHAESLRQQGHRHDSYHYNEGLYSALTLVYAELEEVLHLPEVDEAGVHHTNTKSESSLRR
jgi:hypothetical protein